MSLASEMNRIASNTTYTLDETQYTELIEQIKGAASIGEFYIDVRANNLSANNKIKLIEEGFKVDRKDDVRRFYLEHYYYKISWEDVEE